MVKFTADASLESTLRNLDERTEIVDANGRLIGYFTPAEDETAELYRRAREHFDPEELKRRKESNEPDYTTAEVIEYLNSLDPQ